MKISIIIPVYNVEQYLRQCIDSVLAQTYADFEVLLINDGSTDKSGAICDEYATKDSRIKVFHKENGGVSSARNLGLDNANGQWIAFVDADDTIDNEYLHNLIEDFDEYDLDVIYPQIQFMDASGNIGEVFDSWGERTQIEDGFTHKRRGFIFALYNKNIIGNTRFNSAIVIGEDALFNIMIHSFARRITANPNAIYYYRKHSVSVTQNILITCSDKNFNGIIKNIEVLKGFIDHLDNTIRVGNKLYYDRPFYLLGKMAFQSVIIPTVSVKKLKFLKNTFSQNGLQYINDILSKDFKYYDSTIVAFYCRYKLAKIYHFVKSYFK